MSLDVTLGYLLRRCSYLPTRNRPHCQPRLHRIMGEYKNEGRVCDELAYGMYTRLATYLAKENPPTRPDRDVQKSPENCGDEDSAL